MHLFANRGTRIVLDLFVLLAAIGLAFLMRFEFRPPIDYIKLLFFTAPYVVLLQYTTMLFVGVHRYAWRFVGIREAGRILLAIAIATTILVAIRLGLAPLEGHARYVRIPLGVLAMDGVLAFLGVTGLRVLRRAWAERGERRRRARRATPDTRSILLIGAGSAGVAVAREISRRPDLGLRPVGFIDDDPVKHNTEIEGLRVLGDTTAIGEIAQRCGADEALISIVSAPGSAIRRIVARCEENDLPVKIVPGMSEILDGSINLSRIREVSIEDLLGRAAVELDRESLRAFLAGQRVLITGAGGSIGSELCRQVAALRPETLILVEQAENALFQIHAELTRNIPELSTVPAICDVCDSQRVERIFATHKPQVVFHAAAHKHVPMMEYNPGEAVKNNVFGTRKVAEAADRHGVGHFVLISTDKAVNPTSIMGATKRVAEVVIQDLAQRSKTCFVAVRFGNVLGSVGSVVPVFQEQIRRGGPVTVTHPEMRRYFMTIPEACQLVMQAGALGRGGEVFVLDMGEPVRIVDLARDLIRLSGLTEEEIPIEFSGVRPGEKLFEEIGTATEGMARTHHAKIFIGHTPVHSTEQVSAELERLKLLTGEESRDAVRRALRRLVPQMQSPAGEGSAPDPEPAPGRGGRTQEGNTTGQPTTAPSTAAAAPSSLGRND